MSSYRDYILTIFGILFSLLTAILAAALVNVLRIYFEKNLIMIIIFCPVAIVVLIKLFKKLIGLKLLEETIDSHNLEIIKVRFEKEIKRIYPNVQKIFHISSVRGAIIYNVISSFLTLLYSAIIVAITIIFAILFFKLLKIIKFYQLIEEMGLTEFLGIMILLFFLGTIIFLSIKTFPLYSQIDELFAMKFEHTVEFIWNQKPFFLNLKECHVIFDPNNDIVLIKFLDEEEYLNAEKIIRDLGLEYADDTAIFYR